MSTHYYCIVWTTTDSQEIAELIASRLIERKLAACVQVDEINSFFKWQGQLTVTKELRLMIKGRSADYQQIQTLISSLHNYQVPEIIMTNITEGLPAYLRWLEDGER